MEWNRWCQNVFFLFWYHRFNFGSGTSVIEICVFYVIGVRIRNPWRQVRLWHIGVRWDTDIRWILQVLTALNSKVHEANIEPTCGRQDQGGRLVGHVNLAIWESFFVSLRLSVNSSVREIFYPFLFVSVFPSPSLSPLSLSLLLFFAYQVNTQRNTHVIITSKRRFDVIITCSLHFVFAG